jgi:cytoskeleton protein RodZ
VEGTGQPATLGASGGNIEALELGATLREMRLALKRDLEDVADELRIRPSYLVAIEEGRFGDLPGSTYALGFVRAYADAVGFDPEDAARRFKLATVGAVAQPHLYLPAPVPSGGLPTGAVLLAGATLAVLAYGGWYVLSTQGQDAGTMVASLSGKIAGAVREAMPERGGDRESTPVASGSRTERGSGAPAVARPSSPNTTAGENAETTEAGDEDEDTPPPPPEQVVNETPPPVSSTPSQSAPLPPRATAALPSATALPPQQQAALPSGSVPAAPEAASSNAAFHRIVLVARADSWVELRDASGASIYSRVLRKDERYDVPGRDGLTLMTGNAGGLEVLVDGQTVPALGTIGAVKRNISLDPDKLRAGTAVPPAPAPQPAAATPAAPTSSSPATTP